MTEMVERVARALVYWSGDDPDALVHPSKPLPVTQDGFALMTKVDPVPLWQTKVDLARVAIAAMREPTDEMATAPSVLANDFGDIWQAMIAAALGEK